MEHVGGGSSPDKPYHALGNHGTVKDHAALLFGGETTSHQGGLGRMETGNGPASDGDEHHRENGFGALAGHFRYVHVGHAFPDFRHGTRGGETGMVNQAAHDAEGHEKQADAEDGVNPADQLVDGKQGRQQEIDEDDGAPERDVEAFGGQVGQKPGGTGHEDRAAHDHEQDADDAAELFHAFPQVFAGDFRDVPAIVADGKHAGHVVVDGSPENAADDNPDIAAGTVHGPQDGPENGAEAGDVEKLDHEHFPSRHGDIIDPVGMGLGGCLAGQVGFEDLFDEFPVNEVAQDKKGQGDEKADHGGSFRLFCSEIAVPGMAFRGIPGIDRAFMRQSGMFMPGSGTGPLQAGLKGRAGPGSSFRCKDSAR